ncbi:MAG: tRNA preQ1(34) S-adenosylmethionine ribosyltransferase-isomerase QueA, partial [Deltaproteobacteria bacterium]|nr:tRNA preQ1(34) S-adenosylmethionine ribosyltransferase-isomerase QueA [Deltaproteobacteria bacterium]
MSFDVRDYEYDLPPELIAQEPAPNRSSSRLMVVNKANGRIELATFRDIGRYLPAKALIVLNEAKVTPARLLGRKKTSTGRVELLILDPPLSPEAGTFDCPCLGKPGRSLTPGTELVFGEGRRELPALVLAAEADSPRRLVRFFFPRRPLAVLEDMGRVPLPPYIKRPARDDDAERYQTVYATSPGAIAAPTAGLHFTPELLAQIQASHEIVRVNLRVGAGTFAPLTDKQLQSGRLHEEFVEVGEESAQAIRQAQSRGDVVLAVGTTTARALEWAVESGQVLPRRGPCDLFIRPGYRFKAVQALITNFHLPGSSLTLLVGAFMGQPA